MARTPVGKRVRSIYLAGGAIGIIAGATEDKNAAGIHLWDEDVTVIGVAVTCEALITDAAMNADADLEHIAEVSRAADRGIAGGIAKVEARSGWTAAIVTGGEATKTIVVMFPAGYGVDFDDGESIYMNHYVNNGSTVTLNFYENATVYYVER